MTSPEQVSIYSNHTQNTTKTTADPIQVTIGDTYTHNIKDLDTFKLLGGNGGEKGGDYGDDDFTSPKNLCLVFVSRHVELNISSLSGTTDEPIPHPPER